MNQKAILPFIFISCILSSMAAFAETVIIRDGELVLEKLDVKTLETDDLMADTNVLYVNGGKVGIGTTNPQYLLDINGTPRIFNPSSYSQLWFAPPGGGGTENWYIRNHGATNSLHFTPFTTSGDTPAMVLRNNGRVGIGTSTPNERLEVNGNIRLTTGVGAYGAGRIQAFSSGDIIGYTLNSNSRVWDLISIVSTNPDYFAIRDNTAGVNRFAIDQNGNVGIGKTNPAAKLDVNGNIRATELCDETGANCKDLSGGWGSGIPSGFCIFSSTQGSCPAGWTRSSTFDDRTIMGDPTPGTTGGSSTHAHTTAAHTLTTNEMPAHNHQVGNDPSPVCAIGNIVGFGTTVSQIHGDTNWFNFACSGLTSIVGGSQSHSHGNTGSTSSWPPYVEVIVCCKD